MVSARPGLSKVGCGGTTPDLRLDFADSLPDHEIHLHRLSPAPLVLRNYKKKKSFYRPFMQKKNNPPTSVEIINHDRFARYPYAGLATLRKKRFRVIVKGSNRQRPQSYERPRLASLSA